MASERLCDSRYMLAYRMKVEDRRKVDELFGGVRMGLDNVGINERFKIFKELLVRATELVGYKLCRNGEKDSAW